MRGLPARLAGNLLDVLLPNRCLFCGAALSGRVCACTGCLEGITLFTGHLCARCGAPLDATPGDRPRETPTGTFSCTREQPAGETCPQCRDVSWSFTRNVSLCSYEGAMRLLIHQLKFGGRRGVSRLLGALAVDRHAAYIGDHHLLVPVPLAGPRRLERGYNQAMLLAKQIASCMGACGTGSAGDPGFPRPPVLCDALLRRGACSPQSSLGSFSDRVSNMRDRFILRVETRKILRGKRVLLVDDVLTSGATASACARTLLEGGAGRVDLLTAARTLRFSAA
ncbi:MAG: ComF family protein [Spirochaetota bacterium]